jgi:DedD protein
LRGEAPSAEAAPAAVAAPSTSASSRDTPVLAEPEVPASASTIAPAAAAAADAPAEQAAPAPSARASEAPARTAAEPSRSGAVATAAPAAPASGDWAVQLGSFGDEANARRLADRVSAQGYSPSVLTHRAGGRVMYRVRLGPHATREAAEAVVSTLTARGFVAQVVTTE